MTRTGNGRNGRTLSLLLLPVVLAANGCALMMAPAGAQVYHPLVVQTAVNRQATFEAAKKVVAEMEPAEMQDAPEAYWVSAVVNQQDGMRDRVIVMVREDSSVSIEAKTEIVNSNGEWVGLDAVCNHYTYAREKNVASLIQNQASLPATAVLQRHPL